MFSHPDILKKRKFGDAPSNYIPGLGRGAVGFTTRSDIGPARDATDPNVPSVPIRGETNMSGGGLAGLNRTGRNVINFGPAPVGYVAGSGRGVTGFGAPSEAALAALASGAVAANKREEGDVEKDYSESNFNAFDGYSENLFANAVYEADDHEADAIYNAVDRRMDSKRKTRREEETVAAAASKFGAIKAQFADVKRELNQVTLSEWENLPEATNQSRQRTENKFTDRFTPVPDSIIKHGFDKIATGTTVDPLGGTESSLSGGRVDFEKMNQARKQYVQMEIDKKASGVSSGLATTVDPKGYMTELQTMQGGQTDISDVNKVRALLNSVISTNPTHAPGWVAAARLEETAGKLVAARQKIARGCEVCPESEDVWLESARLNIPSNAKSILAKAVQHLPTSVKLWIRAADLETDIVAKRAVLRRGLELIPASLRLWKEAVQLEAPEEAIIILSRAVECVPAPESLELWLALAKLESYENAQVVLNNARTAIPSSHTIWLAASKLEEANGQFDKIDRIVKKAVKSMESQGIKIDRSQWLSDAELAEKSGSILTCQAIIRATAGLGVDKEDQRATWLADTDALLSRNSVESARAMLSVLLSEYPTSRSLWEQAIQVEKQHGNKESISSLLQRAVEACPQAETIWLMAAKEKWLMGDVPGARALLKTANIALPSSENIWLAAVKLEFETGEIDKARALLSRAREKSGTEKVWIKSACFEREVSCFDTALNLTTDALQRYPNSWKLWLIGAQIAVMQKRFNEAKTFYTDAIKNCPNCVMIWTNAAEFEVTFSGVAKARAILEQARLTIPNNALIWLKSIKIENESNNSVAAKALLARALQECPSSGQIWAYAIEMEPRPLRKSKSVDAVRKCHDDPYVLLSAANLFWGERLVEKARSWFNRAVTKQPDFGDAWAYFYKFELQYGLPEQQQDVMKRCVEADPRHGDLWQRISKEVGNMRLKAKDILPKVADLISNQI